MNGSSQRRHARWRPDVSNARLPVNRMTPKRYASDIIDERPVSDRSRSTQIDVSECLGIRNDELRTLLHGLSGHKMWVYWIDFSASLLIGYAAFIFFPLGNVRTGWAAVCSLVATACLYRAMLFTHEISHMPRQTAREFSAVWNVLCGIPLLAPSFLYEIHAEHHAPATYGTAQDGEYLKSVPMLRSATLRLILVSFVGAPAFAVRFLLSPVGWLVPCVRRFLWSRASALVIDVEYRRRVVEGPTPTRWTLQEAACFTWVAAVLGLAVVGVIPIVRLISAYAVLTAVLLVNSIRVAVAHRYAGSGQAMSLSEQVLDSNSFPRADAALWAPLGLRFHALHHLLPGLPYHSLPEAHRRIMRVAPSDSLYRRTICRSLFSTLGAIFGRSVSNQEALQL